VSNLYGFVIMETHFHLIWQMKGDYERKDVQRDFLKYTGQRILLALKVRKHPIRSELLVNARDRRYQVWERNSLSISLESFGVFIQKLAYIHNNPVAAGVSAMAADYMYSSAAFYYKGDKRWDFLTHFDG
jgi:putative transposase